MKKLQEEIPAEFKISLNLILEIIEEQLGIEKKEVLSKKRKDNIAIVRAMCFHILLKEEGCGPLAAGGLFDRDHSTALHGEKIHQNEYETSANYRNNYDNLIATYLYRRENSDGNPSALSQIMHDIDIRKNKLERVKRALLQSSLTGDQLDPEVVAIINEIFPEHDKRRINERNIANGIRIN